MQMCKSTLVSMEVEYAHYVEDLPNEKGGNKLIGSH